MKPVVLIFGGTSEEKLVSTATAQNVVQSLKDPECWFMDATGSVHQVTKKELIGHQNPFTQILKPSTSAFAKNLKEALPRLQGKTVFMGFHETEGEDGGFQKLFEQNKISFTGSDSVTSDLCFNKLKAKKKAAAAGLPLAEEIELPARTPSENVEKLKKFFHEKKKLAMKPVANGSSVGLHIIHNDATLQKAIQELKAASYDFMAEEFIAGRELTAGVFQKGFELIPLPASEVITEKDVFFDYEGKYLGKGTTEITPAKISAQEMKAVQDLALKAHKTFGCYGYSRTDIFLTHTGLVFIETNTLPGLTKASFYPQQLEAADIPFSTFTDEVLRLAEDRK